MILIHTNWMDYSFKMYFGFILYIFCEQKIKQKIKINPLRRFNALVDGKI